MLQVATDQNEKGSDLQKLTLDLSLMASREDEELLLKAKGAELILEEKGLGLEVYAVEEGMIYATGLSDMPRRFLTKADLERRSHTSWISNTIKRRMH